MLCAWTSERQPAAFPRASWPPSTARYSQHPLPGRWTAGSAQGGLQAPFPHPFSPDNISGGVAPSGTLVPKPEHAPTTGSPPLPFGRFSAALRPATRGRSPLAAPRRPVPPPPPPRQYRRGGAPRWEGPPWARPAVGSGAPCSRARPGPAGVAGRRGRAGGARRRGAAPREPRGAAAPACSGGSEAVGGAELPERGSRPVQTRPVPSRRSPWAASRSTSAAASVAAARPRSLSYSRSRCRRGTGSPGPARGAALGPA